VRTTVADLQQQMKTFSMEFSNRSEPGLIEELRRALAKTARRVMELQEQLRSTVAQEHLTEIRHECQEMIVTYTDDLQEQIVSLKQALVSLQMLAHQMEGQAPAMASLRQEFLTLQGTISELRQHLNALQDSVQEGNSFPAIEFQVDNSLESAAEEIRTQITILTHRLNELELSIEQAVQSQSISTEIEALTHRLNELELSSLEQSVQPPFLPEEQPPQPVIPEEVILDETVSSGDIVAHNGFLHNDEPLEYVTLSQNITAFQELPPIDPEIADEDEEIVLEPVIPAVAALPPAQADPIDPQNLLIEALETATDRLILTSALLEQCHLNSDLFEQFDDLLSRGVKLEIGWSLSGFIQNSHFFRRINHRWYPDMNQSASLYSVLRHFKQLAKTDPNHCHLCPMAHRDQLLICDRRFAVLIPEVAPDSTETLPSILTDDDDTIREWIHKFEQPDPPSSDAEFYFMRAAVRYELDDIHGVISDYSHGLRFDPMNASAYNNRGLAFYNLGGRERALEDFDQALDLEPANPTIYFNRAGTRSDLGDRQGAVEDYSMTLRLNPLDESAYNNRGLLRSKMGDYTGAQEDYTESIRLDPNNDVAYNNRALIRSRLGDKPGAITDYTEAIRLNPHDDTLYFNRGAVRASLEDYEGALTDYTEALRHNPGFVNAYNNRGFIHQKQGNKQAALADFSRAIEINPNFANAYNNRGTVRSKLKDYAGAIEDFNRAITLNPHFANAYNNRGTARSKLKDLTGAIEDFNMAIRLNSDFANAYNNRGLARADLGELENAIEDLMRAARLFCNQGNEPSSQQSLTILKKLHHNLAEAQSIAVS
ncbi:MAG: tetratricopeptide repeat protein, partial [Leptolyngbyaceae cyanobacterium bins.59]|nr:tetratricopeptide repeat protein [Leptolyngbyaceae cyanobacterium bins.59]